MSAPPETLLCLANYPANTGYAWDLIEGLYARIADHLAEHGIRTLVGYPALPAAPRALAGSAARAILIDADLRDPWSVVRLARAIRRERIRTLYLSDRPAWHPAYLIFRALGVRWILVHDHSGGERTPLSPVRRRLKSLLMRIPGLTADVVIAVSEFVARRQRDIGLVPAERVVLVLNSIPERSGAPAGPVDTPSLALPPGRPVVMCACRAAPGKGLPQLLHAFDRLIRGTETSPRPLLVYVGDGPELPRLKEMRETLRARDDILLTGYRPDALALLARADLCVAPSTVAEAFCLSVLEPMALGKPVVAFAVGAIPELIEDGVTGSLVPRGDEGALTRAIGDLLRDPARRARLGSAARIRATKDFTPAEQLRRLTALVERGFEDPCAALSG